MEKQKMGGVVFPLVTPFCGEDEHVNYPALDKLIDFLIENGATGVIPCGSTGELVSMTLEEQLEINRHLRRDPALQSCGGSRGRRRHGRHTLVHYAERGGSLRSL